MGEVYRARDTRLDRIVALKIVTSQVAARPELRVRFEREARTLATLSHPHICSIFDVGQQDGVDYLVMEFLEGQTLAHRLERGALPFEEASRTAIQLTDALDKAHRQGIVHRDLKPANIVLTRSGAKVLDFGLAKLHEAPVPGVSGLPTNAAITGEGTLLGTLEYMAPEQLEAREVDGRTDIFALGSIIYEMITGKRAFAGTSQASVIAAILEREPPAVSGVQPLTPPALDRVIRKCLAKDPDDRWQSAGDLLDELKWIADTSHTGARTRLAPVVAPSKPWLRPIPAMGALLVAVALAAVGGFLFRRPPVETDQIRFDVAVENISNPRDLSISPDGRTIAFTAATNSNTNLFVRRIDASMPELLAGTEGAANPFWSPDSAAIAFYAGGRLKKVSATGGAVQNITDAPNMAGGTWNADDVIVFSAGGVLNRTSAAGGQRTPISVRDESKQETSHQYPYFLPDGTRYVYLAWSPQQSNRGLYLGSLDSTKAVKLMDGQSKAVYRSAHLLFHRDGTLFAQPFDAGSGTPTGEAVRIAEEISYDALNGAAAFDVSSNGRLVYYAGGGPAINRQFRWLDRAGRPLGGGGNAGLYTTNFDLSPDGTQIAVAQRNRETLQYDVWLLDWARSLPTRFTFDPALTPNGNVVWSPDGRIAFASERAGNRDIFEKRANGVGAETPLLATSTDEWPEHWSADGRYLAYGRNTTQGTTGSGALFALPLFGDRKSITVSDTPFNEDEPRFSNDGRWLAYNSNESGTHQVYVVSFPEIDQKRQISTDGGAQPHWRRDGKELYYLAMDGRVMTVDLRISARFESDVPRALFNTGLAVDPIRDQFAVTADGQRFLVQLPVVEGAATPISVIVNWTRSLQR